MEKLDLTKTDKAYYTAKPKPELVTIGQAQFLSLTGKGDPSSPAFSSAIEALYSTAYTIKFLCKNRADSDFVVAKLEGLWWFDETQFGHIPMEEAPQKIPRSEWFWRLLIRMPDFVTSDLVKEGIELVFAKKGVDLVKNIELFTHTEGVCLQMLHVGAFDKEPETLKILQDFCQKNNLVKNGLHHEIYLSDFRKTTSDKLKTILREPVRVIT